MQVPKNLEEAALAVDVMYNSAYQAVGWWRPSCLSIALCTDTIYRFY